MTQSVLGALPLAILIPIDEKTQTLIDGFALLKSWFTKRYFDGRGPDGPIVIMTDNCTELRDALSHVFPNSKLFYALFIFCSKYGGGVCESKHAINLHDRSNMLQMFKDMVYATSENELFINYKKLIESTFSYHNFQSYMQDLFEIRKSWTCCYRMEELIRGSTTNNYVESHNLM